MSVVASSALLRLRIVLLSDQIDSYWL